MGRGLITHSLRKDIIHHIFLLNLAQFNAQDMEQKRERELEDLNFVSGNQEIEAPTSQPVQKEEDRIGRNDSCPYGSGKKYKKCCMKK